MPSRIRGHRRAGLAGFAGLVLTVGLALTGCDPSAADGGAKASPSAAATATAQVTPPAAPPAAPASSPAAPPVSTPPAAPGSAPSTPAAPAPAAPSSHAQSPAPKTPQPKITTAQPPTDPEPQQTAAAGGGAECEIRSNAGNCYAAGQFCRNADLGRSTHDANGRMIYCRMVSGKPHWQA
ncbi:type IV secretory pathway VirB10-like protein [Kitasatospora sp. MAA19]|uniref:hypothetical protein n=1 Tax=Kitasatospora sp. MAA19 TaxID=3035090 RepID=UPI002475FAAD|nr:hypothetical protein [Kitasatospora sp. MAA19]MDH6706598.1 type IV secretory pathway VirB10-like protein [Kitasatospora sp. MAA19]